MFYKSYYVLFLYIFISAMRAHNINKTNSTRGYGETGGGSQTETEFVYGTGSRSCDRICYCNSETQLSE